MSFFGNRASKGTAHQQAAAKVCAWYDGASGVTKGRFLTLIRDVLFHCRQPGVKDIGLVFGEFAARVFPSFITPGSHGYEKSLIALYDGCPGMRADLAKLVGQPLADEVARARAKLS